MPEEIELASAAETAEPLEVSAVADAMTAPSEPVTEHQVAPPAASDARMRWFELALILFIAFSQYIFTSIFMLNGERFQGEEIVSHRYLYRFMQEAGCLLLLGYILSRRKLRFKDIGLRWSVHDLWRGPALLVVSYLVFGAGGRLIGAMAHSLSQASVAKQAFTWGPMPYEAIPILLLNPFFEELIVRAYLMTEVRELTGSSVVAVIVSVAVQTSYHLYYGWKGALSLAFLFLVFSVYYARSRRITSVILVHAFLDLRALVA
jgi:membrane protease YdiL (CAAX protease family)